MAGKLPFLNKNFESFWFGLKNSKISKLIARALWTIGEQDSCNSLSTKLNQEYD